ncbi:MAG: hypothetical protein KatS3mg129_0257 [Leptospiraceae bacterium]|nr:MAG: hypothetical protein KatS3mg129_0257 [Leptospiraceae bacterium]
MITIQNYDSKIDITPYINSDFITKIEERMDSLLKEITSIPIYLVNEETMDKIYPPQKLKSIDQECVIYKLEKISLPSSFKEIEKILEECERLIPHTKYVIAVGVYIRNIPYFIKINRNDPVIFICPERCENWAKRLNIDPLVIFQKVIYHEYGHAYMDVDTTYNYYDTRFGKLIEESLANLIALLHYKRNEVLEIIKIIYNQPMEYKSSILLYFFGNIYVIGYRYYFHYLHNLYNENLYNKNKNKINKKLLLKRLFLIEGWKEFKKTNNNRLERFFIILYDKIFKLKYTKEILNKSYIDIFELYFRRL